MTEADLIAWCGQRIAGYKRPRGLSFVRDDDIPRTATGKVQHGILRDRLLKGEIGAMTEGQR